MRPNVANASYTAVNHKYNNIPANIQWTEICATKNIQVILFLKKMKAVYNLKPTLKRLSVNSRIIDLLKYDLRRPKGRLEKHGI